MIAVNFTEEELVEIANHTVFTAFHALEDDTEEAHALIDIAVAIIDKIEAAYPDYVDSEELCCEEELAALREAVANRK
jgi:hypothetical protein